MPLPIRGCLTTLNFDFNFQLYLSLKINVDFQVNLHMIVIDISNIIYLK